MIRNEKIRTRGDEAELASTPGVLCFAPATAGSGAPAVEARKVIPSKIEGRRGGHRTEEGIDHDF
ncbi:MAG: hypothetical protein ACHQNE_01650 [Candidatus Kapaibacterium sp.]